jgi:hypothetical protein
MLNFMRMKRKISGGLGAFEPLIQFIEPESWKSIPVLVSLLVIYSC